MAELEQSADAGEQPTTDSTDTAQDQVAKTDGDSTLAEIDLDGEKVTPEQIKEWKKGYMRQEDYTKKTQKIAEAQRELARTKPAEQAKDELEPEVKAALETLKKAGVATKDDLLMMKAQEADEKDFRKLIKTHPELQTHKKALKQIGLTDNRAWVDIAKDYGFLDGSKLEKAKASKPIIGARTTPGEQKATTLPKAGTKEWEAWKKSNLGQGKWA